MQIDRSRLQPDTTVEPQHLTVRCLTCGYSDDTDTSRSDRLPEELIMSIAVAHVEKHGHVVNVWERTEIRA